jgi:hypothetical protein
MKAKARKAGKAGKGLISWQQAGGSGQQEVRGQSAVVQSSRFKV